MVDYQVIISGLTSIITNATYIRDKLTTSVNSVSVYELYDTLHNILSSSSEIAREAKNSLSDVQLQQTTADPIDTQITQYRMTLTSDNINQFLSVTTQYTETEKTNIVNLLTQYIQGVQLSSNNRLAILGFLGDVKAYVTANSSNTNSNTSSSSSSGTTGFGAGIGGGSNNIQGATNPIAGGVLGAGIGGGSSNSVSASSGGTYLSADYGRQWNTLYGRQVDASKRDLDRLDGWNYRWV